MAEYVVMPRADYQDACDAAREKFGGVDLIKSGDMASLSRSARTDSPNGTEWVQSNITTGSFNSVHNGGGMWVAGGSSGLFYSKDGKTWTAITANGLEGKVINKVLYGNGLWVAASDSGLYASDNGTVWVLVESGSYNAVSYANGYWFSFDTSSSTRSMCHSTNGTTWTFIDYEVAPTGFKDVCYANGHYVLVGGSQLHYGDNVSDEYGLPEQSSDIENSNCVLYANGQWVVGNNSGIYSSTNGKTWTKNSSFITTAIHYANGLWLAGSCSTPLYYVYYSTNGASWLDSRPNGARSAGMSTVYYANGIWIVGSDAGIKYFIDDANGGAWAKTNVTAGPVPTVHCANGIWVAGCGDAGLWYSVAWAPA